MNLLQHLELQGISGERALELLERKRVTPSLTGCVVAGRWVTLVPATGRKFDEMVASGVPPASNTDREFMSASENGRQFQGRPEQGDFYKKVAEQHGQSITGKKYLSQLARFPGDPQAWISSRGDVQKVLEERGWGSDGLVNVKARPREEASKPVDVAEDIVDRETAKEAMPGMKKRERLDLREKVKAKLKGNHKK